MAHLTRSNISNGIFQNLHLSGKCCKSWVFIFRGVKILFCTDVKIFVCERCKNICLSQMWKYLFVRGMKIHIWERCENISLGEVCNYLFGRGVKMFVSERCENTYLGEVWKFLFVRGVKISIWERCENISLGEVWKYCPCFIFTAHWPLIHTTNKSSSCQW